MPGQSLTLLGNTVTNTGTLKALGGTVQILGDRVALLAPTHIDVSSPTGGGTVRVGGDFQGQGTLPTATATYVDAGATIHADATSTSANGGSIVLWANNSLKAYGTLTARAAAGNGGMIETSSANVLDVAGIQVDASTINGTSGTWLIDPRDVIIRTNGTTTGSFSGTNPDIFTPAGDSTFLSTADIETRLNAGTNVTITTGTDGTQNGDIIVLDSIQKTVFTPAATLTLAEANDIFIAPGVAISALFTSSVQPLNLVLQADSDNSGSGNVSIYSNISTQSGTIDISGRSVLLDRARIESSTTSTPDSGAGSGAISITADSLTLRNGSFVLAQSYGSQASGEINLQLGSSLSLSESSSIFSDTRAGGDSASITINLPNPDSSVRLNSSQIGTGTFGQGDAGNVSVTAGSISLLGSTSSSSFISSDSSGGGGAGTVAVTATTGSIVAQYGSVLSGSRGFGDAGTIGLTAADTIAFSNSSIDSRSLGTGAGSLQVSARRIVFDDVFIRTSGFGREDSGDLQFRGSESIDILNNSRITTATFGNGNAGTARLETPRLTVNNSTITSETYAAGNAGAIVVAADSVAIANSSRILSTVSQSSSRSVTGNGQVIAINARNLSVTDSTVSAETFDVGNAGAVILQTENLFAANSLISTAVSESALGQGGKVDIQTRDLTLVNGAQVSASTVGAGAAGDVEVAATGTVNITGKNTGLFASTRDTIASASGDGGNITVQANTFVVQDTAQLAATTTGQGNAGRVQVTANRFEAATGGQLLTTTAGSGRAGNIVVNGGDRVTLSDPGTGLFANTTNGLGGAISVNAPTVQVINGAVLNASTSAANPGGNITVNAQDFTASTGGQLLTTTSGSGNAGDIELFIRDRGTLTDPNTGLFAITTPNSSGNGGNILIDSRFMVIRDQAEVAVGSQGTGQGGSIAIQADRLTLQNQGVLTAETASTQGGNITLNIGELLLLRTNSLISTTAGTAQKGGDGGIITINAPNGFIVGVLREDSDIRANAFSGNGGKVNITAQGIFGLQFQPRNTPLSDITASSQLGISGTVTLNTLNVDPNRGLVALPVNLTDPSSQVSDTCAPKGDSTRSGNSFIVTGRGGLPSSPEEGGLSQAVVEPTELLKDTQGKRDAETRGRGDVGTAAYSSSPTGDRRFATALVEPLMPGVADSPITEAQGWMIAADGTVDLLAQTPTTTPNTRQSGWQCSSKLHTQR